MLASHSSAAARRSSTFAPTEIRSRSIASSESVAANAPSTTTSKRPLRRGLAVIAVTSIRYQAIVKESSVARRAGARATRARLQIWVHPAIPGQSAGMDRAAAAETTDTTLKPLPDSMRRLDLLRRGPMMGGSARTSQLLNYLNVSRLPLGLVLFVGPQPKVKRVIR